MTLVTFSRKEFEKYVRLTQENIEKISMFGTPLESFSDREVEIEIFPNRPDLLPFHLYIKSFLSFLGKNSGMRKYSMKKPQKNYDVLINPNVKSIRPFTVCAIVRNLSLDDDKIKEIIDVQEKLHLTVGRNRKKAAIGIYPLEEISLPIRYMALKPDEIRFIPLDSAKEMNALEVMGKHPVGRKYAPLLDGYEKYPVFIDSKNEVLSMPPIINSQKTGRISEKTRDVFIECSGHDFNVLDKTLSILVTALSEMGGEIFQMNLHYENSRIPTPGLKHSKISLSLDNANKLLGLNLKEREVSGLLSRMGFEYKNKKVLVPAWRVDILHEVDIIEDIAIAYGYDKFSPEISAVPAIAEELEQTKSLDKLSELLVGLGLLEVKSYHLIKQKEIELMKIQDGIEVENSKTEYKALRSNLLIPALRFISENKDNDYPQEIFEIGTVFFGDKNEKTETGISEKENLLVLSSPSNFTKIKQLAEYVLGSLGVKYAMKEEHHPNLIEGRTASLIIGKESVGFFGEIHPETLRAWNIKMPVAVMEISLEEIFRMMGK